MSLTALSAVSQDRVQAAPDREQIRHECEVRLVTRWPRFRIKAFLEFVAEKRTKAAYTKLRDAVVQIVGVL